MAKPQNFLKCRQAPAGYELGEDAILSFKYLYYYINLRGRNKINAKTIVSL